MTREEYDEVKKLVGKYVRIKWKSPYNDWPYFRLTAIKRNKEGIAALWLTGKDFPDGSAKHRGDSFVADWEEIKSIESVLVAVA